VERAEKVARVTELRDYFIDEVLGKVSGVELNGPVPEGTHGRATHTPVTNNLTTVKLFVNRERIANNVNISIPGLESEELIIALDARGIAVAARSACISDGEGSYVVRALGKGREEALSSLRFSLGPQATREDVDHCVQSLAAVVQRASVKT
jgi:cysteine desulfurase